MIEAKVFPNGFISDPWKNKDVPTCVVEVLKALASYGIHDDSGKPGGDNHGLYVAYIQATESGLTPNGNGDAWCEDTWQSVVAFIEDYFQVESPVFGSDNVYQSYMRSLPVPGLVVAKAEIGSQAAGNVVGTTHGHSMPVIDVLANNFMITIEGNTSIAGLPGDGLGKKTRYQDKNGDIVTLGFVRVYPYNKVPA